ncbi:Fc.00g036260.m01.CDS01 [Cosmosporella sp. VM-42]
MERLAAYYFANQEERQRMRDEAVRGARVALDFVGQGLQSAYERATTMSGDAPITDDTLAPYAYAPLPTKSSIRLLSFSPDEKFGYACSLESFELALAPSFLALSYTWGNPIQFPWLEQSFTTKNEAKWHTHYDQEFYFKIDGRVVPLKPGRNLDHALRRLRDADESLMGCRYLWVDALCINQEDKPEQTSQMLMMGEIYQRATKVVAWLGKDFVSTGRAIKSLEELRKIPRERHAEMQVMDMTGEDVYAQLGIKPLNMLDWTSLTGLLMRGWFSRVWIVQEAIFARHIVFVCGKSVISADLIYEVSKMLVFTGWSNQLIQQYMPELASTQMAPPGGYAGVALMREELKSPNKPSPLNIMAAMRSRQATKPEDSVYGLLNVLALAMGREPETMLVLPDRTTPLEEIMQNTTLMISRYEKNLTFLHQVQEPALRTIQGCASWTVNWGQRMAPYSLIMASALESSWNPSGRPEKAGSDSSLPGRLRFKAAKIGEIDELSPDTESLQGDLSAWLDFALRLRNMNYGTQTDEGLTSIVWRTTLADSAMGQHPAPPGMGETFMLNYLEMYHQRTDPLSSSEKQVEDAMLYDRIEALNEADPGGCFPPAPRLPEYLLLLRGELEDSHPLHQSFLESRMEHLQMAAALSPQLHNVMTNRRLARTSDNFLAVVPTSSQVGNGVWVLPGMATPFVFQGDTMGEFEFVGEAYVHGIMHGEISSRLQFKDVTLR